MGKIGTGASKKSGRGCMLFEHVSKVLAINVSRNTQIGVWCSGAKKYSQMIDIGNFCLCIFQPFNLPNLSMVLYDVIWCDMMWYDVIWYDVIWCGMMWYDMVWYYMIWFDLIWRDIMWFNAIVCDMMWYDLMWCDMIWCDMIQYDTVWSNVVTPKKWTPHPQPPYQASLGLMGN